MGSDQSGLLDELNIVAVRIAEALKARGEKIAVVSLVPPVVSTVHPNFPAIQAMIQTAIDKSERADVTLGTPKKKDITERAANTTDDLSATC